MAQLTTTFERKNTRSVKWDRLQEVFNREDVLPMWIADMDFKAPKAVNDALMERVKHGYYGYTVIDDDVKQSIINWNKSRHQWEIKKEWLSFSSGVVTSLHIAVQALTEKNDKILIQTPVYTPFYNVIEQHERQIIKNPLVLKDNYYTIDFNDFEEKLKQGVKAFILCSPHNPVGRVWKEEELQEMARLCLKHDVYILSDEIHGDLIFPGYRHIPFASLSKNISERTVTMMAPSKTFNIPGLQASYIVTENDALREKINHELEKQGVGTLNTMGNIALEAAYNHGEKWLDDLLETLQEHKDYVVKKFSKTGKLSVIESEGTYLLWIDCSALKMDADTLNQFMVEEAKVGLNSGVAYGEEAAQFMRMNIACPKKMLKQGVKQITKAVKNL